MSEEEDNKYENNTESDKQVDDDNELVEYHKKGHEDDDDDDDNKAYEQEDYNENDDEDYSEIEKRKKSRKKKEKMVGNKRNRDKKKKKRRRRDVVADYIEGQAEEDEDEESVQGEVTKEQQEKELKRYDELHFSSKNKRLKLTDENVEEVGKRYQEREKAQQQYNREYGQDEDDYDDYENMERKPTKDDPKLWLIKCKINEEKECLANLFHKYIFFSQKEPKERLKIYSIISFDNLKGKIFIEAYTEKDVINAVSGISTLNEKTIKIIPLNEMPQIFEFDKLKKVDIQNKQLVRIKNGVYKDDLAKVIYVEDPINRIYIAVVPRVYEDNKSEKFNVVDSIKKQTSSIRPRQKLFDENKYGAKQEQDNKIGNYYQFGKKKFINGLLIKVVKSSSLETEDIFPKTDEIQKLGCIIDEDGNYYDKNEFDTPTPLIISNKKKIEYKPGDKVRFLEEDFKSLKGTVVSQDGDKIYVKIDDYPEDDFHFDINKVVRDYKPGDMVSAISGNFKGKKGCIIKIIDNINAVVYNELEDTKFTCNMSDLILSKKLPFQNEENSMFKIGELVKINNSNIICYIIDSSKYSLKVVTTQNELKSISAREVEKINLNKRVTNIDCKRNPIAKDNCVKVINGPFKGSKGTIKNIYKRYVFLHDNKYARTNGIFCEINENLELLGSELLIENSDKGKVNHRRIPIQIKDLLGKVVHVVEGNWKGYNGIVKDVNDKTIKLELSAKQKTIQLPYDYVSEGDINSSAKNNEDFSNELTPNPTKTPAYYQ